MYWWRLVEVTRLGSEEGLVVGDGGVFGGFVGARTLVLVFDDGLVVVETETIWDSGSMVLGDISAVGARSQSSSLSSFSKSTEIVLPGACTSNT